MKLNRAERRALQFNPFSERRDNYATYNIDLPALVQQRIAKEQA